MIYIVEIPHQRPASCWAAIDEQDAMDRINADLAGRHIAEEAENFDDAIRLNGADLYAQYVLTSGDAMDALSTGGKYWNPHQRANGLNALRKKMSDTGEMP